PARRAPGAAALSEPVARAAPAGGAHRPRVQLRPRRARRGKPLGPDGRRRGGALPPGPGLAGGGGAVPALGPCQGERPARPARSAAAPAHDRRDVDRGGEHMTRAGVVLSLVAGAALAVVALERRAGAPARPPAGARAAGAAAP